MREIWMTDTELERKKAICDISGVKEIDDVSDGFHTFRQLYYQRMMLFAAIVKQNKGKAWKSLRHEDGELCFGGGWFIVGIDTPEGSYTYHYENKYFDLFDCEILDYGKHWDGHTEKDVTRLLTLPSAEPTYTDEEIQKIQDLEQAQIKKAYQLGYEEGKKDAQSDHTADGEKMDCISRQAAIDIVHKIIYGFFDLVDDDSEESISDKDKLLLEVNKTICNGIKDLFSADLKNINNSSNKSSILVLSELRGRFNCFDEKEKEFYEALSNAIRALRKEELELELRAIENDILKGEKNDH